MIKFKGIALIAHPGLVEIIEKNTECTAIHYAIRIKTDIETEEIIKHIERYTSISFPENKYTVTLLEEIVTSLEDRYVLISVA